MRPILIATRGFELRCAAVCAGIGALAALLYLRSCRQRLGLNLEVFWALALALVLGVFAGGIVAYAALYGPGLAANLGRLAHGQVAGGSFFGVFWGAIVAAFIFCRLRGLAFAPIRDCLGIAAALGLVFIRLGCLLNGCCYGRPTERPWGIVFRDPACRVPRDLLGVPLHPTQLYEMGGAAMIFLLLRWAVVPQVERESLRAGSAFLLFVAFYAILRFAEDFCRASDPGLITLAGLTTAQLLCVLTFSGAAGVWLSRRRVR